MLQCQETCAKLAYFHACTKAKIAATLTQCKNNAVTDGFSQVFIPWTSDPPDEASLHLFADTLKGNQITN